MNTPVKLAGFVGLLGVVFAAATLAGGAVGPLRPAGNPADSGGMAMAMDTVRGLAVSENGLTLDLTQRNVTVGEPVRLRFRITDARGATVRDFDMEHTKRMHLIVVRRDLTGFQHLHPVQAGDGSWTVPVTLTAAGSYRVFADFSVDGRPYTLADDIQADGVFTSHDLPAPSAGAYVDGFDVRLDRGSVRAGAESELSFAVTRHGRPVAVQDYLGAKGHLVALRAGDLAFLHIHPDSERLSFAATFPSAGSYRLFLQFQIAGRVHTAAFTQQVAR